MGNLIKGMAVAGVLICLMCSINEAKAEISENPDGRKPSIGGWNNDKYFAVWVNDTNKAVYGFSQRYFRDDKVQFMSEYGQLWYEQDIWFDNGHIYILTRDGKTVREYELVSEHSDYLAYKSKHYDKQSGTVKTSFNGRLYSDAAKASEYQKSFEVKENDFFTSDLSFEKPEVIEHVSPAKFSSPDYLHWKTKFKDYGNPYNSWSFDQTGITLTAVPNTDGSKSRMRGSFRNKPMYYRGIATEIETASLDEDRKQRIRVDMNGYNDGSKDTSLIIQILKDKVVFFQWRKKTPSKNQKLKKWITVLDEINFSNKTVKLAMWVDGATLHFYAECNGQVGHQTYDISGSENNLLEGSYWANYRVESKKGGGATKAKFKKIYVLR